MHLKWSDILPLVLFYILTRPRTDIHVSPFEMLSGHLTLQDKSCTTVYASVLGGDIQIASCINSLQERLRELHDMGLLVQSIHYIILSQVTQLHKEF